jgi:hypothetical protein
MRDRTGVAAALLLSFVLIGAGAAAQSGGKSAASKPQSLEGYEFTVLSLERMATWSISGKNFQPKDKTHEFVVVHVRVRPLQHQKDFFVGKIVPEVHDAAGKVYKLPLAKYGATLVEEGTVMQFPFSVPIGAHLKSLHLGSLTFDLGGVAETKAT